MIARTRAASRCTIYEVARKAGVSIVTVSRVFNDYPHVSSRTRQRVLTAARQIGYAPRVVSRPRVIGVIVGHLDHLLAGDYKSSLMLHLMEAAARREYLVEFVPVRSTDLVTQHLVSGVIELGLTSTELAGLEDLPDVPVVFINKKTRRHRPGSTVCTDHADEARQAAECLWRHGHRRILLLLDELEGWSAEQRRRGFQDYMREAGAGDADAPVMAAGPDIAGEVARLARSGAITACISLTDNFGLAMLGSLVHGYGLRIPEDLSVVCLENEQLSAHFAPPLTTIRQPLAELAAAAVDGVAGAIERRRRRFHRMLRSRLVERKSVAAGPAARDVAG
jgi:DNA-binding LacI/PurR family transcriptional regulator